MSCTASARTSSSAERAPLIRPLLICAGTVALVACSGGGDGGRSTIVSDELNCPAVNKGTTAGYALGVCAAGGSNRNRITLRADLPITVTINDYSTKLYTLNLNAETGPNAASFNTTNEDACLNVLGGGRFATLTIPNPTGEGPYAAVISGTQAPRDPSPADPCSPVDLSSVPPVQRVELTKVDFGTWERFVGGVSYYYGGWYTPLTSTNVKPVGAKRYNAGGRALGYVYTTRASFGTAAPVRAFEVDADGRITATIDGFQNARSTDFDINQNALIGTLSLQGNANADGTFVGTLSGTVTLGNAAPQPIIAGAFEGRFFGPAGDEVAGRWWVRLNDEALSVGSFGAR